jgi:hypothetical protein
VTQIEPQPGLHVAAPVLWPALTAAEAVQEWDALRVWVDALKARYPNTVRMPSCWFQHNDLVEALSALRDLERICFAGNAPASGPIEWQRALRDTEVRIDLLGRRFTCSVADRDHASAALTPAVPAGWSEFVAADVERRRATETA